MSNTLEQIKLPRFVVPFSPRMSPHQVAVEAHSRLWAKEYGLVRNAKAMKRFDMACFSGLAARTYPSANFHDLCIVNDWTVWLFMQDDQFDEAEIGKQSQQLQNYANQVINLLENPRPCTLENDGPLLASLAELWQRMCDGMDEGCQQRFIENNRNYFTACMWEAENRALGYVPTIDEYIVNRRETSALKSCVDLIYLSEKLSFPDEIRDRDDLRGLADMANDALSWANDVISFPKEYARGDVHNLVTAIKYERGVSVQEAVDEAADYSNRTVAAFVELEATVPSFGKEMDKQVDRFISVLKSWIRGNLDWSYVTGRYNVANVVAAGDDPAYLESITTANASSQ